MAIVIIIIIIM
uniref:Uncharacterized protein n=1 Tax=Anguilla anguilla TaxID=7936 RepID=A0A0E9U8P4_ANGAN